MKRLPFRLTSFAQDALRKAGGGRVEWPRRWLFNLAAVASALLCLATALMWVWSYWHTNTFSWKRDQQTSYFVSSHRGRVEFARQSVSGITVWGSLMPVNPAGIDVSELGIVRATGGVQALRTDGSRIQATIGTMAIDPHTLQYGFLGMGWANTGLTTVITIPDWALICLFGGNAAFAAWRLHRVRFRPQIGLCPTCGYDLRATPQRCPECGIVPPAPPPP